MDLSARTIKRSVTIAGHSTSVSLEAPFWDILKDAANERNLALAALIAQIDEQRGTSLSSALRLFALAHASGVTARSLQERP